MQCKQHQSTRSEFTLHQPVAHIPSAESGAAFLASGKAKAMRVAVYARYSTDGQKETSIDDQIRVCRETAARQGLTVSDSLIFADDAITGAAHSTHKREQYHALRESIRQGKVDVILCDQQCRLARSAKESLTFFEELKEHNVRLLTADGFDSEHATSQLLFGIKSVFSEFFLDETRHRVRRGMMGEFERDAMVTAIPYGYRIDPVKSAATGHCCWMIHPDEAEVVREIFRHRKSLMNLNQIAAILNARQVPTSRERNGDRVLYWRSTGVWRILQNPIYKGVYQVNFRAAKGEKPELHQRLMNELSIVSSEDWDACMAYGKRGSSTPQCALPGGLQQRTRRATYGGGKHALAGVFRCGVCGASLSCHHPKTDSGSLHCIQCEHATAVGVPGRQPNYVSVKGVQLMLRWLLDKVISGEAITRYREQLRRRLEGGRESELIMARQELDKQERAQSRLARLLREIGNDDPALEQQYLQVREMVLHQKRSVAELEQGLREVNHDTIHKQLNIDLSAVLDAFLADTNAPGRTRALLNRIFPSIVLVEKEDRYTAIFRIEVRPGAILVRISRHRDR